VTTQNQASSIDTLVKGNRDFAPDFLGGLPAPPARNVAVVTCMDARIDPQRALGAGDGDLHVIRNAGGLVVDDTIRSLAISQHKLGTTGVMIVQHTECGLATFTDDDFRRELAEQTGSVPPWEPNRFEAQDDNVRDALKTVRTSPFLPHRDDVRGFIFDVQTGLLREIAG
jgi:carbonic anhydrase